MVQPGFASRLPDASRHMSGSPLVLQRTHHQRAVAADFESQASSFMHEVAAVQEQYSLQRIAGPRPGMWITDNCAAERKGIALSAGCR